MAAMSEKYREAAPIFQDADIRPVGYLFKFVTELTGKL